MHRKTDTPRLPWLWPVLTLGVAAVVSCAVATSATGAVRIEAEDSTLTGYHPVVGRFASGDAFITLFGGPSSGSARTTFPGPTDDYDIVVAYFDESDGHAQLQLRINGALVQSWQLLDDLAGTRPGADTLVLRTVATARTVPAGAAIEVRGFADGDEHAGVDYVEFSPAGQTGPTATPTRTRTPTRSRTPTRTRTPRDFACTQVIGFSQTRQWYTWEQAFETATGQPERWQLLAHNYADIESWADPGYLGWSTPIHSPCDASSRDPDRVVLTITGVTRPQPQDWLPAINAAIMNIRDNYPSVQQIVLQPVVGGPNDQACTLDGQPVRASVNHPQIDAAIALAVGGDVVAGMSPVVVSCSDYVDNLGHIRAPDRAPLGQRIGDFYRGF